MFKKLSFFVFLFIAVIIYPFFLSAGSGSVCYDLFDEDQMSFKSAKSYVRDLHIETKRQFVKFVLSSDRPENLPMNPSQVYEEWISWEDFLGVEDAKVKAPMKATTKQIKKIERELLELEKELNLSEENSEVSDVAEIDKMDESNKVKKKENLSKAKLEQRNKNNIQRRNVNFRVSNPRVQQKTFPLFKKAIEITKTNNIKSAIEYKAKYKELGLPSNPNEIYKDKWQSWGHFLGTGNTIGGSKKDFLVFESAMEIVKKAGITGSMEYRAKYKELGLPSNPDKIYKDKWQSWGHFLGTGRSSKKDFPIFESAMEILKKAGITGSIEYKAKYKELGLPASPNRSYKNKWQGWGHFLGTGNTIGGSKKDFPIFDKAMEITKANNIKSVIEYNAKYKELGLPSTPNQVYKDKWQSWGHFLGTGNTTGGSKKDFPIFESAMEIVKKAGITSKKKYNPKYKELGLPSTPNQVYKDKWQGWPHFLGKTTK